MKSKAIWALAVVNVLLLASLCLRGLTPAAHAQAGARPSDYIMIPGEVIGGNNSIIYIVDTRNGLLGARTLDPQGKLLVDMGAPIDLNRVMGNRR
jgi:hypothetical protein